ncbi:MAG TPA: DUF3108 domain-containing protein, partial [Acidobacteriota bacterium]|nr:DUF3108 domain-containing protein [Acidobacteriota bacterium]
PRHTSRLMVGNNDKVNEVSLQVEKEEFITTPLGRLSAWKVGVASLLGELFRESGRLNIWFSNDDKRLPIQFEVRVRLGKVVGELKEYHP